jgi:hypothetical protein
MAELQELFASRLDPQKLGDVALLWSRRVLAALAIFIIGRLFLRALTNTAIGVMRRVGLGDTLSRFLGNLFYTK